MSNRKRKVTFTTKISRKGGKSPPKAPKTAAAAKSVVPEEPPYSFQLPKSFTDNNNNDDDDRFELWSIRLPASVNINDLKQCNILPLDNSSNDDEIKSSKNYFESNGPKYSFRWGDNTLENETFQVLVEQPKTTDTIDKNNKDDDDDNNSDADGNGNNKNNKKQNSNNKNNIAIPCRIPFHRHLNVIIAMENISEIDMAPRIDSAPEPTETIRHAYQSVPQKTGLKRRWRPLGGGVVFNTTNSTSSSSFSSNDADNSAIRETRPRSNSTSNDEEPAKKKFKRENVDAMEVTATESESNPKVQEKHQVKVESSINMENEKQTAMKDQKGAKKTKKERK